MYASVANGPRRWGDLIRPGAQMTEAVKFWIALAFFALCLAGAVASGVAWWTAARRADGLHAEIYKEGTGYRDRLSQCRATAATLDGSLKAQNAAVERLETDIAEADKRAKTLKAKADRENAKDDAEIVRLRKLTAGPDRCEAARKLLKEAVQ
jgi:hypothetical protein